ncbi:hypothetical protein [Microbacterium sp. NPDC058389]|uniref:hypothetical protein n=1 Tax=Microbacterium sp. NPDC058389 TaxID=3346475 RepID=UPI003653E2B2
MTERRMSSREFARRVEAGITFAQNRWSNADDELQLHHVLELGAALNEQGVDGANEKAAEIESTHPDLKRR